MGFELRSSAFEEGSEIPNRHTCEGEDVSPPLRWTAPPRGTKSLALIVEDPDAPDPAAPKTTWVHWIVVDLPPEAGGLAQGAGSDGLPPGARAGRNDWKRTDYGGPCPPIGRHRYFHRLYALDTTLRDLAAPTRAELLRAMEGHVLKEAVLIGTYKKSR